MVPTIMAAAIPMRIELGEVFIVNSNDTSVTRRGQPPKDTDVTKGTDRSGRNTFGWLEPGKCMDGLSRSLLGQAQLVEALQIKPELGAGAEEMGQAKSGVAGKAALSIQDGGNSIG